MLEHHRWTVLVTLALVACAPGEGEDARASGPDAPVAGEATALVQPGETRIRNLRQLTFGGDNAEAYFSFDGERLIFQHRPNTEECDQIYTLDIETGERTLVSTGAGRTTCSYFYPSGDEIVYSSTHHHDPSCPAPPDMSQGYVWPINETYDIFIADADGSDLRRLTDVMGYDAEATVSPTGDRVVFTSNGTAAPELYTMKLDGTEERNLTQHAADDRAPSWSPGGNHITFASGRDGDMEILKTEAFPAVLPGPVTFLTFNTDLDDDPDWGELSP